MVDDRIHGIRLQTELIEGHKAVILAALSIADECFQAIDELAQVRKEVASRVTNLTHRIDAEMPASNEKV